MRPAILISVFVLGACDSAVVENARQAQTDGKTINNEAMVAMYPETFREGEPVYLERDFEAGADFICDEMAIKFERDVCADEDINWR